MRQTAGHITIIILCAIALHLPFFTGWLNPVAPNFTWWAPWNTKAETDPPKGSYYDYLQQYLPWQKYLHDSIEEGELPLWNRFQFCGTPFMANHLLSPFYPPIAIGLLVPYELSIYLTSLIHFLIGSIFMYLFLRRIEICGPAALAGALVFCTSGMFMPFYPPWPSAIAWLPAILFIVEGWLRGTRGWRDTPWLALILAFWFMEGYPIFIVHSIYFIVFYIILTGQAGRRLSCFGKLIVAFLLGLAISAIQNLPTLFFMMESARFKPEVDDLLKPLFSLRYMLNHFLPVQTGAFKISYHYLGLIPFLLMPFAAIKPDSKIKYHFFWFGACILLGLIPYLFVIVYKILPFWGITAHPPVIPLFFSSSILSAYGAHRLWELRNGNMSDFRLAYAIAVVIFLVTAGLQATVGLNTTVLFYILCNLGLLLFILVPLLSNIAPGCIKPSCYGAIVAIILLLAVPWYINFRVNRPLEEILQNPIYEEYRDRFEGSDLRIYRTGWQQNLPPNMGILWGVEDAGGYDSLVLRRFYDEAKRNGFEFYRGRESLPLVGNTQPDVDILGDFGIGLILTGPQGQKPRSDWGHYATTENGVKLYANPDTARALFLPEGNFMDEASPVDYFVEGPNGIRVNIGGDKIAGSVIVKDSYAGGWKAWVDGERSRIEPYHGWMRKVDVPAGAREIVMRYEPIEFTLGAFISAISLFMTLTWLAGGYRRRKQDI